MFEELFKSIRFQIYERATSPLLGTFILSWMIWNYKLEILLLSSSDPFKKFDYIENTLYPTVTESLFSMLIYPSITTIVLLLILPVPARWFYEIWRNNQKTLQEIKQKIEDETPLTKEQYRKVRMEIRESEIKHVQDIEQRDSEINELKSIINKYDTEKNTISNKDVEEIREELLGKERNRNKGKTLTDEQENILKFIDEKDASRIEMPEVGIWTELKINKTVCEYLVDKLNKEDMIHIRDTGAERFIKLKSNGRSYLVENNLIK